MMLSRMSWELGTLRHSELIIINISENIELTISIGPGGPSQERLLHRLGLLNSSFVPYAVGVGNVHFS